MINPMTVNPTTMLSPHQQTMQNMMQPQAQVQMRRMSPPANVGGTFNMAAQEQQQQQQLVSGQCSHLAAIGSPATMPNPMQMASPMQMACNNNMGSSPAPQQLHSAVNPNDVYVYSNDMNTRVFLDGNMPRQNDGRVDLTNAPYVIAVPKADVYAQQQQQQVMQQMLLG